MEFISVPLEEKNKNQVTSVQTLLNSKMKWLMRKLFLHIGEVSPCMWLCQATYTISESLPKRVGTCFENCSIDGAKHGKEHQHQQAGVSSTWCSSGMGKIMLNVKAATCKGYLATSLSGVKLLQLSSFKNSIYKLSADFSKGPYNYNNKMCPKSRAW